MANVNVTYEEMNAQADKLNAGRQEIESQLDSLRKQVEALVANGFVTDTASERFRASYEEFNSGAKETISGLEGMGQYLRKAAQTFQDADSQLASSLG